MTINADLATRIEQRAINDWNDNDCWLSDRCANSPMGYSNLSYNNVRRYQHVITWEMHNAQPVPDGMVVMHTCDNPRCFNPNHLIIGTQQENVDDAVSKGRHGCRPLSLSEDDVNEIRKLQSQGISNNDLMSMFGVSESTFYRALKRY